MTTYTVISGQSAYPILTLEAADPFAAAVAAHEHMMISDKRSPEGFRFTAHGPAWGRSAHTHDGNGNGGQSLDDCLIVAAGEVSGDRLYEVYEDDRTVAIIRAINQNER